MKIGFVLDDSLDKTDGVQQYVLALGRWLSDKGHEVHYLVGESKRRDLTHLHSLGRNVNVRFNRNRMSMPLPVNKKQVSELLKKENFDILHIQMPYSPWLAARVIKAAPDNCAVVGTFHIMASTKLGELLAHGLGTLVAQSARRFDRVFSVSEPTVAFAKRNFGVDSEVLPCAVNLEIFRKAKPLKVYQDGHVNIVFLGRLVERKGCHYLLAAVKRLREIDFNPIRVIICGPGPQEKSLKAFVHKHGLDEIVHFIGHVDEEKARYLASAQIAAFPSTEGETFGIVLIEAMASGSEVVIAGDNPGYRSVMDNQGNQLIDPRDTEAFAKLLKYYINNPAVRRKRQAWQRNYAERFDVQTIGGALLRHYQETIAKRRSRSDN